MREWWKRYIGLRQNITALAITCLAAVIMCFVLFVGARPGVMDFGQYNRTLSDMGLSRTVSDLNHPDERYFTKVIEEFTVDSIKLEGVLQLTPTKSLIYPVTFISVVCKALQINFSTVFLAAVLMVLILCAVYACTKALYPILKNFTALAGILLCATLLCGSYVIPLGSLYNNGMFLASLWLFMAAVLKKTVNAEGSKGIKSNLPLLFCALLLLNSINTGFLMLPFVGGDSPVFHMEIPPRTRKAVFLFLCTLRAVHRGLRLLHRPGKAESRAFFKGESLSQCV